MKVEEKRYQYGPGEWRVRDGCKAVVLAEVKRLEKIKGKILEKIWTGDEGVCGRIKADFPDFAARMEKPAPRSGTVWLNVWLVPGQKQPEHETYDDAKNAKDAADDLDLVEYLVLVRAQPIEWTEDE